MASCQSQEVHATDGRRCGTVQFAKGSGPDGEDMLRVVYDMGPVKGAFPDSFDKMRCALVARMAKGKQISVCSCHVPFSSTAL